MIRITCTNCQKPLSLDESKLPQKEVSFPCPACKAKIVIDGRAYAPAAAPVASPAHGGDDDDQHENEFGEKAIIVGEDDPALRQAAKLVGFLPVFFADPKKAREFYMQEFPQMVFIHPAQMTPPPLDSMAPIISLLPADRRKSFFVLVADNLRTLDGNAAFLYGVNLVLSRKDLAQFPDVYREAHAAHERLYASINAVVRERQLG
jgi:DNA-directed RNA polymerase subunit RPC12/RpoP